jgi:hypothetical protein
LAEIRCDGLGSVGVEQAGDAAPAQFERERQANRAATDDEDRRVQS